jgi:hypothetical protein
MLLKLKKEAFALTVIGLSFSFIILIISFLRTAGYYIPYADYLTLSRWNFRSQSFDSLLTLAMLIVGTIFIFKPNRPWAIVSMVFADLTANVFIFIADILVLVKMKEIGQEEEKKRNEALADQGIIANEEEELNVPSPVQMEMPTHVEFTAHEQSQITAGIALASIYLALCLGLTIYAGYSVFTREYQGNSEYSLNVFFFGFLVFVAVIYSSIFIVNIVVSGVALNKKSVKSVKIMRAFGFISLTIFNSVAGIHAINRVSGKSLV